LGKIRSAKKSIIIGKTTRPTANGTQNHAVKIPRKSLVRAIRLRRFLFV
jgi:hypothetical protein